MLYLLQSVCRARYDAISGDYFVLDAQLWLCWAERNGILGYHRYRIV